MMRSRRSGQRSLASLKVAENASATVIGIVAASAPNYAASRLTVTLSGPTFALTSGLSIFGYRVSGSAGGHSGLRCRA